MSTGSSAINDPAIAVRSADVEAAAESSLPKSTSLTVAGATVGTVFEWYDFFVYAALASVLAQNFFSSATPALSTIFTLLAFSAGFLVRPFGALVFGRLGDLVGRKYTFLLTMMIMGISTFLIGLLPTQVQIGVLAPWLLTALRLLQGLAVGGEYGSAVTYMAEHAPRSRRGRITSFLQTTPTLGFLLSVVVVIAVRASMSNEDFVSWGWRIPFLGSAILLVISVWIRLKLEESPVFLQMKRTGAVSKSPIRDCFSSPENIKAFFITLFGVVIGGGVVLMAGQIYTLIFLIGTLRVDPQTVNLMLLVGAGLSVPTYIFFGVLSDYVGRKPLIIGACLIGALVYFPLYKAMGHFANPALEAAQAASPVKVEANPADCSLQFNILGTSKFTSSCDVAKSALIGRGVPFTSVAAAPGTGAVVVIADKRIPSAALGNNEAVAAFQGALGAALQQAGYPTRADPAKVNHLAIIAIIFLLCSLGGMVFGPTAAALTEAFPPHIRNTSVAVAYNVGAGWVGGLLPAAAVAIQAGTGDLYAGLWYPVTFALVTFVVGLLFFRDKPKAATA